MKRLTVFLALTMLVSTMLSSSCVRAEETSMESSDSYSFSDEKIGRWWYPHYPPYHYPRYLPKPKPAAAHPPLPAHHFPKPPPEVIQCFSDRMDLGRQCHAAVVKAYFTRNPDLGADCCAAISKMHQDCEKLILGAFHNPYFNCFIKLHCAASSSPTPSAPAPAA